VWDRDSRSARVHAYWSPPSSSSAVELESVDQLALEAERLLEDSVRSRMISDVPLGVFLSGGLDSTLIAALAARNSSQPIKTFTVGYDRGEVNECDAARVVAQEVGSEHHELILRDAEVALTAPGLLASLDQPLADQALIALHAVAEFARGEVTVAVGGEGADELFAGYPRYRWLARADRLAETVPAPLGRAAALAARRLPSRSRAARLAEVLEPTSRAERHLDWVTSGRRHLRPDLYGTRLQQMAGSARVEHELAGHLGADSDGTGGFMLLDQTHWLPDDVLAKADRAGMLASLEVRTPYLHREVAEFAARVPPHTHVSHSGKALLRLLRPRLLPGLDGQPRKTAFRVPARDWLRSSLAPTLAEQVRAGALYEEGWFDREAVGAIVAQHTSGERDWSAALWPLLALGAWLDGLRSGDGAHPQPT
jgi:asparagine synthase (glutamine-hydrolysing)